MEIICPTLLKAGCSDHAQSDSEQLQDTTLALGKLFQCLTILTGK